LLGLYVAEGSVMRDPKGRATGVTFTFHHNERELADFVQATLGSVFGVTSTQTDREVKTIREVLCFNTVIGRLFEALCGSGCDAKRIPAFVYCSSRDVIRAFVGGVVDGDGRYVSYKGGYTSIRMTSRDVVYGLRLLIGSLGYAGVVTRRPGTKLPIYMLSWSSQPKYRRFLSDDDYLYFPLKAVAKRHYHGTVFNLEVEEDNSYVSDFAVHNCEVYVARGSHKDRGEPDRPKGMNHLILLATNLEGYRNLVRLTSFGFTEGYYYKPRIDRELLQQHREGLIGLSACLSGVPSSLVMHEKFEEAECQANLFNEILGQGNYFLEVQKQAGIDVQDRVNKGLVELSRRTGIPLAVTNDSHLLNREDFEAHRALLSIGTGKPLSQGSLHYSPDHYFRSMQEMWLLFGRDLPEALENTVSIADRCNLEIPMGENQLPVFRVPDGHTVDSYFAEVARRGLEERWENFIRDFPGRKHSLEEYKDRLEHEIRVITQMGFPGYFLIVWDFIRFAKEQDIPVGPGRGSAAGSLAAYSLKITDVDPMQYDLLFERFLNPERVSMPDIDIDFCVRGRGDVIKYVSDYYGRDHVSQIITFGTMASKAAIKDVGRALEMPFGEVDRIAKMIPPPIRGRNVSIEDAIEANPDLKKELERNAQVKQLIDLAKRLEGCSRHASVHAAGVVISPKPIHELVPVYKSAKDEITTQYAMSDLEKTGMLKMDFLALTTLTIIEDCLKTIERETGSRPDLSKIPLEDPDALRVFGEGRTDAIFQFESSGMKEICRKLGPEGIDDLAALNALYRPGPIDSGMVDDFIDRRHGRKKVTFDFAALKDILGPTLGIVVFQEQVMALFQRLAGYSLGEADIVRRIMGKKKRDELDKHREKFISAASAQGHDRKKLEKLWQMLEGFADYAFNKSHSVAYALLAYQTAYLKAHYPTHFWAAVLSNELDNTDKVARYIGELRAGGIQVLPPDVNVSNDLFTPLGGTIRFGLVAIKGLGQSAVSAILDARRVGGPFTSMHDFCERVDSRAVNKRVLECLIKSGAFDGFGARRRQLFAVVDAAIESGTRAQRDRATGQVGLFAVMAGGVEEPPPPLPDLEEWSDMEILSGEKETLGFYITGHPLARYRETLAEFASSTVAGLDEVAPGETVRVGGLVVDLAVRNTKKGDRFALFQVEDTSGSVKVVCWPETFKKSGRAIVADVPVLVCGKLERTDDGATSIIADEVAPLDNLREREARSIVIHAPTAALTPEMVARLHELLDGHRGDCDVQFALELPDGSVARIQPNSFVRVAVTPELTQRLHELCPECRVEISVSRRLMTPPQREAAPWQR
jgi:DNA polymerase-3 subunit alpha